MIQYAKLHQKDVISVIIPNFFLPLRSIAIYAYRSSDFSSCRGWFCLQLISVCRPMGGLFWRSAKPGTFVVEVPGQELARPL